MNERLCTCPCCGYRTLGASPGSYGLCHVCFWEDDPVQLLDPWYWGGANPPSLVDAQRNFASFGACEARCKEFIEGVLPGDQRDPEWRLVEEKDRFGVRTRDLAEKEWEDLTVWYYWKRNGN